MIIIVALPATGSDQEMEPLTIGVGTISTLTHDRLVFTRVNGDIEFRKKVGG